jgi:hypothetical protein
MNKTAFLEGNMKKKLLSLALSLTLMLTLMPLVSLTAAGDARDLSKFLAPILPPAMDSIPISNRAELEAIASSNDNMTKNYHLTADIDLSGAQWFPLQSGSGTGIAQRFGGIFDGQGFVIRNMTITRDISVTTSGGSYFGLFGQIRDSAVLKNIGLENVNIDADFDVSSSSTLFIGAFTGNLNSFGSIDNCYVTGKISVSCNVQVSLGGIAGSSGNGSIIRNSYNTADITVSLAASRETSSTARVGGIVGAGTSASGNPTGVQQSFITGSHNTGNISVSATNPTNATAYAGGIVGRASTTHSSYPFTVTDCYNTGNISAFSNAYRSYAGGINGHGIRAERCYNTGDITASAPSFAYAGGISAFHRTLAEINKVNNDCFNIGNISASSSGADAFAGGIYGQTNAALINCYNTGSISVSSPSPHIGFIGGIAGEIVSGGTAANCYWNRNATHSYNGISAIIKRGLGNTSPSSFIDTATPLTIAQMKVQGNFAGFDFDEVWTMGSSLDGFPYPYLRGMPKPDFNEPRIEYNFTADTNLTAVNISNVTATITADGESLTITTENGDEELEEDDLGDLKLTVVAIEIDVGTVTKNVNSLFSAILSFLINKQGA